MQFQKDSNNNRIRQRRVYIQDNTPESEPGDIIYGDPNGIKTLQNNIMILMKESRVQFQTRQDQYFKKIRAFLLYS